MKNISHKKKYTFLSIHDNQMIIIIGGLLLIGLTLATGIAVYGVMRQQIESSLGRGLDVALQGKGHLLESQIEKSLANARAQASHPLLIQAVETLSTHSDSNAAHSELDRNIQFLTETGFAAIAVFDMQGKKLSEAGRFSDNQAHALPLDNMNNRLLIWDKEFILHSSEEIIDQNGRSIGRITIESTLPQLSRRFGEIRSIGESGTFVLCAPAQVNNQKMACLLSQVDGIKFKYLSRATEGGVLPMDFALSGKSGVVAVRDYRNIPVIEAYAPLSAFSLGMILKLDETELFEPIRDKLKIIIVYVSILIIAEILLLNGFIRRLINSEREAQRAKEDAEQISLELSHKETQLQERLKEITCLYEIRRSVGTELSVNDVCRQILKNLISAMQYPEKVSVTIEIDGSQISSNNHKYHQTQTLVSKIKVNGKICGHLSVFYPDDYACKVSEEQRLIDTITGDLADWLERRQVEELLHERLKEITCLYEIRRSISLEISLEKVCQNIFKHLIPAMQFPEIASAVIELDGRQFVSINHHSQINTESSEIGHDDKVCHECYKQRNTVGHILRSAICVSGKECGYICVFYPEDKPYLIQEEQKLIDAIASDLESWLERKHLEQALVFIAEEQAFTIGQELHDNLGQQIAAVGYQVRALEKKLLAAGNETMIAIAASIASQVQTAVIQIKQLAQGLLPFELEANGLVAALEKLASRIANTYSITCNFTNDNETNINDKNLALNFYRIAQEAVNNAIRHGAAQNIEISLSSGNGKLFLSISDDGRGFVAETKSEKASGMGIKIMRYRSKELGAKLQFLPRTGGGTEVRLEMGWNYHDTFKSTNPVG